MSGYATTEAFAIGQAVRVCGQPDRPCWCRGETGKIICQTVDGLWLVNMDKISATELRFHESELERA